MYLRINGLEVKAEQYIGNGHLNVQTVRGEVKVHSTDWMLTFPGGVLTVLPNTTVEGLIAGEDLPSTIGEVHARTIQTEIDGPFVNVEVVRQRFISEAEGEKAKLRARYPELKEVFDAIEKAVDVSAEQMVARENALKDTTPALNLSGIPVGLVDVQLPPEDGYRGVSRVKADEDLSQFDGK